MIGAVTGLGTPFGKGADGAAVSYLPLTTAWIAETGETDTTIKNALNTFEQGLIDNSLSSKLLAVYPMVGGDATKHKYKSIGSI